MLTLKELKKRVPVAENSGLVMGSVELLHSGAEIVVKETVDNGVAISVFDNGYVLYEEDKHRTVFRLHDCSGYEYKHSETEIENFGEAFFENENWYVLPLMVGMDRVEASRCAILANHGVLSTDVVEYDFLNNKNICVPDFIDKILWEEMVREFAEFLNERQMYAVISYYYLGVSQEEIIRFASPSSLVKLQLKKQIVSAMKRPCVSQRESTHLSLQLIPTKLTFTTISYLIQPPWTVLRSSGIFIFQGLLCRGLAILFVSSMVSLSSMQRLIRKEVRIRSSRSEIPIVISSVQILMIF